jgi:hypothetical protein
LALIIPGFSSASDAGTSFKTMLLAMQGKSKDAIGVMQQLGIITTDYAGIAADLGVKWDGSGKSMAALNDAIYKNVLANSGATAGTKAFDDAMASFMGDFQVNTFYDANGALKDMSDISQILQNSLKGLSEEQKTAALNTMFGTDAYRAAAFIAKAGAEGFDAMGASMTAAGTAAEQAAIRNQTFKFAWDSLLGTLETIQIVIGGALLPILTALVNNALIPAGNAVLAFAQGALSASDPLAMIGAALNGIMPVLAGLGAAILYAVVPGFIAWAVAAGAAAIATLAALAPAIAVGAAVALLYYAWQNNFLGIQDITASVWATVQPYFTQLVDWLSVVIPAAIQVAAQLWSTVLWPALQMVGNFIVTTVIPALSQLAGWLMTNIPAAINAGVAAFTLIATAVSAAFTAIQTDVQAKIATITTVVQAGWNTVVFVTSTAWNAVAGVVGPALAAVSAMLAPGIALIVSVWSAGWATVTAFTSSAWATIQTAIAAAAAVVQGAIQAVISFIQSVWGGAQLAAQAQTTGAWTAIQTLITGAMLAIKIAIQAGVAVVQTIMTTAWAVVVAAAQNDFGKIPAIISAGWAQIKTIMGAGVSAITAVAGTMAAAALSLGKNIVSGIISGVGSMGTALADKLKSMAKSALDAAKSALGIHSPSAVMAAQVGVPIVDGIVAGLGAASPKLTSKMLELAGQMVDLVSKGVDAFGKLRDLGSISMGAISQFVQTLQDTMTLFGEMTLKWDRGMMSAAGQFTGKSEKVVDFLAKGVDFLLKLQTFQGVPQAIIHTFADNLSQAITELIRISTWQIRLALTAAVEFSTGAGKVLDVLSKGVDGLNKLRTMAAPIPGSFAAFALYTLVVVTRMSEVAGQIDGAAVASAGRFADGAGKVLGILSSGVDGLTKLATLGAPVPGMFQSFAVQVFAIVLRISEVAGWLSTEAVTAAATFAEGAGKVIGIIGSGVEAFTKLAKVAAVPEAALTIFAETLRQTMVQFSIISSGWTADMITQAGAFAEGAGKAVAVLSNGVDGFAKLATFASIPDAALTVFAEALRQTMVQFSIISTGWTTEMIAAAGTFADGAGKVLGSIKNGVDGLTALKDLGPVSQAGLNAFATAVQELMTRLTTIAVQFSAEGVAAAGAFSDAAGKAVGILKNGIEGLLLLNTFTGTSVDAMTRFGDGVRLAVAKMAELAAEFGTDAIAAATAFANAAGQSTDFLKKGVEGFLKLADFKAIPQQSMDLFAAGVISLINTIIQLSGVLSTDALAQANTFSNAIDTVITVVLSGLKALSDLGNQAAGIKSFTDALIGQVNVLAQALASQARPAAMNIGFNIALGIADGITAGAGAIQNAIFAAVNQALAAARAALGIASPSAVFRDQIGMQMSAGMAEGVMGGMGGVQAAVGQVASGALSAGQGSSTTNNNQRSISIAPGAIVIQGAGQNADAIGDAVVRRLELAIGGRLG